MAIKLKRVGTGYLGLNGLAVAIRGGTFLFCFFQLPLLTDCVKDTQDIWDYPVTGRISNSVSGISGRIYRGKISGQVDIQSSILPSASEKMAFFSNNFL